jgi:hypothetical protein
MQVTRRNHDALNMSAMLVDGQPVMSYNNYHTLARKVVMTGPLWLVRATPADRVNFIPYTKLLGVE